jgi:hypothetical protein
MHYTFFKGASAGVAVQALAVVVGLIELDLEARSMGQRDSAII